MLVGALFSQWKIIVWKCLHLHLSLGGYMMLWIDYSTPLFATLRFILLLCKVNEREEVGLACQTSLTL